MRIIVFVILALASAVMACQRAEPETYLIPKGYRGCIYIIFNQSQGQAKKYENGRRLYVIPEGGVLLTQFKDDYGWIDQQYFYVDADGHREPLKKLDVRDFNESWTTSPNPKEPSRDELGVFGAGTVGSMGFTRSSEEPGALKYQRFFLSTYRELKENGEKWEKDQHEKIRLLTRNQLVSSAQKFHQ